MHQFYIAGDPSPLSPPHACYTKAFWSQSGPWDTLRDLETLLNQRHLFDVVECIVFFPLWALNILSLYQSPQKSLWTFPKGLPQPQLHPLVRCPVTQIVRPLWSPDKVGTQGNRKPDIRTACQRREDLSEKAEGGALVVPAKGSCRRDVKARH